MIPAGCDPTTTILVIDEQLLVSSALAHALRGKGFDAHSLRVTDLEGLARDVLEHPPGLVLLDLDLGCGPDGRPIDGADLIAPLRARGWSVMVITGTVSLDRIADALARGATSWIVRGATFAELVQAAVEILQGRGQLRPADRGALSGRAGAMRATSRRTACGSGGASTRSPDDQARPPGGQDAMGGQRRDGTATP